MAEPTPTLYELNVRAALGCLASELGRPATLDDLPDPLLDRLAGHGFDWLWCLGVWEGSSASRAIARTHRELRREYEQALPDLTDEDVCGSCFAITGYEVASRLGGPAALERLRTRLRARGIRLMLDFVPNHTARDHPWTVSRPHFYLQGGEADLAREPQNYYRVETAGGPRIIAHGRDPIFPGWTDTAQLDYSKPEVQEAMRAELLQVAGRCDGVRCDMAMLVVSNVFQMTWRLPAAPFWPRAIRQVRAEHPAFLFLAEVYWDLEWTLQQQGFDYTYDKGLYDRLRRGEAGPVREHLQGDMAFQEKLARFLENHDEARATEAFSPALHRAAATVTYLCPGLRFFHDGQLDGRRRRVPVQLCRLPDEPPDAELQAFYTALLRCVQDPAVRGGAWRLLEALPAWEGNFTCGDFVAFVWEGAERRRLVVVVNFGPAQGQCYVPLPFADLAGRRLLLRDRLGPAVYEREGDSLRAPGLYLDMPAWGCHAFALTGA
jgi:glycosidase